MTRWLFLIFTLVPACWPTLAGAEGPSLKWLTSYREAVKVARETGKPIFLEFRCAP